MGQASLPREASESFDTSDNGWTGIMRDVICVTSVVLRGHANQQIIDRVTIIRGYADLSVMYPNIGAYRQRVSVSLLSLSERLRAYADLTFAAQLNSLSDRCRKFDGFAFKTQNDRDVRRYHAEHYRVLQDHNA